MAKLITPPAPLPIATQAQVDWGSPAPDLSLPEQSTSKRLDPHPGAAAVTRNKDRIGGARHSRVGALQLSQSFPASPRLLALLASLTKESRHVNRVGH